MFEREVQRVRLPADELPADVIARFAELRGAITHRSLTPWAEHCTECAMPGCFASCGLYSPRSDFKCRRFAEGIEAAPLAGAAAPEAMKITFRNWGKLEGKGTAELHALAAADRAEAADRRIAGLLNAAPVPAAVRRKAISARYRRKNQRAQARRGGDAPDALVLECYNPSQAEVSATVTLRPEGEASRQPFQHRWAIAPGFNREVVAFADIVTRMDPNAPFLAQIELADDSAHTPLYFGLVDFVRAAADLASLRAIATTPAPIASAAAAANGALKKLKCVVWDLDNTLWAGTLVEDGLDGLVLNEEFAQLIRDLDARGVLHSIASKNDEDNARAALRRFGLEEYFLHPQISWNPKSLAVQAIARNLNIGIDTFIFVDDQPFERAEVSETVPAVTVVDPADLRAAIPADVLNKEPTAESRARRQMYKEAAVRDDAASGYDGDYEAFLRSCGLRLEIATLSRENLRRVHELAQRTNQMNFSGNRYSQPDLLAIMQDEALDTYVLRCADRFGDYGIIGFGVFDTTRNQLQDLMFSCRIQSKRVEHAFIAHLLARYTREGAPPLTVFYRATDRNAALARFFDDMGFALAAEDGAVKTFAYPSDRPIPEETIVDVRLAAPLAETPDNVQAAHYV